MNAQQSRDAAGIRPRWSSSRLASVLGTTAAGAAVLSVAGGLVGARMINGPHRPELLYTFTPFELQTAFEDVEFTAADGAQLRGWWMEAPGSTDVVIASHGFRGDKSQLLGIGTGLRRAGISVLLYDFRGNGESGDGKQSLGFHEQQDLRAAIAWVRDRVPGARISLVGFSMGAAVSLLVAAEDDGIERVVADSAFAHMHGVIAAAAAAMRLPGAAASLVDAATRAVYGYGFAQVRPTEAIRGIAPRPVLLFHSTADEVVPVAHAHELAAAAGEGTTLQLTEGAGHCGSYFADRPGYITRVAEFLLG
ncbi:alpha/beta hydrolase [Brachybacterium sp. Marseille-Q7125]|uniref:alpha/beta hydrolase n=1 Tax=Brachybacterium sp. Marseille-Q7125 TaxID=2932815 RepID=UPI001FF6917B|nr:alpha/beta hydrolase [Brachybacterium sp. Marseille-Q7125]